jgi:hypothetical protein
MLLRVLDPQAISLGLLSLWAGGFNGSMQHHMVMTTGRDDEQSRINRKASERGREEAAMESVAARRLDCRDCAQAGSLPRVNTLGTNDKWRHITPGTATV